jgi:hypothetical protein
MAAYCQPVPRNVAEAMLQVVARALCDRADDSPELRAGRTRQLVTTTLGLAPRDGVELMLATLAFGHFQVILDSMSDVFRGQADALKAKTKTTIVPLGRAMLEMLRELRLMQARPMVQATEGVRVEAAPQAQPRHTAGNHSEWAAGQLFPSGAALQDRGVFLVHFDEAREGLDSELRECHHTVVGVAVDPDDAVFGIHLVGDLVQPVHALAEFPRDAVNRFDGMNLVDVHHAAWAG